MACTWLLRAALCLLAFGPTSAAAQDEYVLRLKYETRVGNLHNPSRSTTTTGSGELAERVTASGQAGDEVEYFKPDRARHNDVWMFPARLMVAADGTKTLLEPTQISSRLQSWLAKRAGNRDVCTKRLFKWAAVDVDRDCSTRAIIATVEAYGMRPGHIAAGQEITAIAAKGPILLAEAGMRGERTVLAGTAPIDPRGIREVAIEHFRLPFLIKSMRVEDAVEVPSYEVVAALLSDLKVSGTMNLELEIDAQGLVWKRTEIAELVVTGVEYGDEVWRSSQTVTRIPMTEWAEQRRR